MTTKLTTSGVTFNDATTQTTAFKASGVSAGTYGSSSAIPRLTINANGQITSATTQSVTVPNNCNNCSAYSSLSGRPSIPNNCNNCSGDVNNGGNMLSYNCSQCTQTFPFNCGQCSQCYQCNAWFNTGRTQKSGTTIRPSKQYYKRSNNCNCNCNC